MHVQPKAGSEFAAIVNNSVDKLTAQGVGRRRAIRRIAGKHGTSRRAVSYLLVREPSEIGGEYL